MQFLKFIFLCALLSKSIFCADQSSPEKNLGKSISNLFDEIEKLNEAQKQELKALFVQWRKEYSAVFPAEGLNPNKDTFVRFLNPYIEGFKKKHCSENNDANLEYRYLLKFHKLATPDGAWIRDYHSVLISIRPGFHNTLGRMDYNDIYYPSFSLEISRVHLVFVQDEKLLIFDPFSLAGTEEMKSLLSAREIKAAAKAGNRSYKPFYVDKDPITLRFGLGALEIIPQGISEDLSTQEMDVTPYQEY
jgi:hypothetical protein